MSTRRPYGLASTRFHLLEALRAISRLEDRDGLNARGLLAKDNIIKAIEKLEAAKKRAKKTRVGAAPSDLLRRYRAELAAASILRSAPGPILARAAHALYDLERRGLITESESAQAFDGLVSHSAFTHSEVKGMSQSDLPSELGSYSDGVTDDAAFTPELVGCGMPGISGGLEHVSIAGGLGDLAVAGLPGYLFTKRNLSNPEVRRRLAENIKALTPKVRRRVLSRLRTAVSVARVSGQVRSAYPTVSGVGWSGITVAGSRGGCPYASVAGPLTP